MKTAVYIGRFQPPHEGHISLITSGLKDADELIILVGSTNCARNTRNPWTFEERRVMLLEKLNNNPKVKIKPIDDYAYNDTKWVEQIKTKVDTDNVTLIGHNKDESSYYLSMFPEWDYKEYPLVKDIHSTLIRKTYFSIRLLRYLTRFTGTLNSTFLNKFIHTPEYKRLREEFIYEIVYNPKHYPVICQTVDALVECKGYVLLVKRKNTPGKGLWALPGGYVNIAETLAQACPRKLLEETGLKLSNYISKEQFDGVNRSNKCRTITTVFHFKIPNFLELTAGDDAAEAKWISLEELLPTKMFEDHYHIINRMLR